VQARLQPLWVAWSSCIKGFIPKHHIGGSGGQRSKYPQPRYPLTKLFLPSHSGSLLAMAFYGSSQGGVRWERDDGGCNTIVNFLISTEYTVRSSTYWDKLLLQYQFYIKLLYVRPRKISTAGNRGPPRVLQY
jgi:hypothetical protein